MPRALPGSLAARGAQLPAHLVEAILADGEHDAARGDQDPGQPEHDGMRREELQEHGSAGSRRERGADVGEQGALIGKMRALDRQAVPQLGFSHGSVDQPLAEAKNIK